MARASHFSLVSRLLPSRFALAHGHTVVAYEIAAILTKKIKIPDASIGLSIKLIGLLHRLNDIPGVRLRKDSVDKYPNNLLSTLASGDALEQFLLQSRTGPNTSFFACCKSPGDPA